jgi:hypothetical protein
MLGALLYGNKLQSNCSYRSRPCHAKKELMDAMA